LLFVPLQFPKPRPVRGPRPSGPVPSNLGIFLKVNNYIMSIYPLSIFVKSG